MKILKWMRREQSGLERTTLEHAKYEARLGHEVAIREPQGQLLWGQDFEPDIETVHSQLAPTSYHNSAIKCMVMHGEPLSSVGNGVSMKAIIDLAPMMDFFVAMRREELEIWNTIKRTYYIPKGIDTEVFCPIEGVERLEGEPAVLIYENPRGARNGLYPLIAMKLVWKVLPKARFHYFNLQDKKMVETFSALVKNCKLWPFVRTLAGPVKQQEVPQLLNRCDIVVSGLFPLYARSLEAFGCGKAFISAGYKEHHYPWACDFSPESMAEAIIACWDDYNKINYRAWALKYHNEEESSKERCALYAKYL
jgi:glycosyltransferase involved in cell wall biosynthesis